MNLAKVDLQWHNLRMSFIPLNFTDWIFGAAVAYRLVFVVHMPSIN